MLRISIYRSLPLFTSAEFSINYLGVIIVQFGISVIAWYQRLFEFVYVVCFEEEVICCELVDDMFIEPQL